MMLSGFRLLRSLLEFAEMRKIYGLMTEKEIRVHVDIEELLEDWDRANSTTVATLGGGSGGGLGGRRISLPDDGDDEEHEQEEM
ncbi:hypothetical protein ABW21_db0207310 [Orbilia brochopaga]|nr:hypothetical protein ABW21_db0207310 [Drechslerella brochopaga]